MNSAIADGESVLHLYHSDGVDFLRYPELVDFYLYPDQILVHPLASGKEALIEIYLLGMVFSLWMELRGIVAMHASSVNLGNRAVAFLGSNYGGKSSLAAALLQQGFAMLSDDVLALEQDASGVILARPAYPCMRLWPEEATYFLGDTRALTPVITGVRKLRVPVGEGGFGAFCPRTKPLSCVYLPERRQPGEHGFGIEIHPLAPQEALVTLISRSFAAKLMQPAGLAPQRLPFFARLLQQTPVRRLIYPSSFEHLPEVLQAMMDDLEFIEAMAKGVDFPG